MTTLDHVELSGTPHERGVTHGEQFADDIRHNIDFYIDYFDSKGVTETEAREYASQVLDRFEDEHENFVTELRGVADGSGCPVEEVALINFRHTILYSVYAEPDADGCTSFGLEPRVTDTGHTYLGQNWDWKSGIRQHLLTVRQQDAPDFISLTEAGLVGGKFGFNDHGIGFCVNGLTTEDDGADPNRTPAHIRGWQILNAERLDHAVEAIIGSPRPTSRNYMIGRASGELIDIETSPTNSFFLYPDDRGILVHTNHFRTQTDVKSTLERTVPHSVSRLARVRRLFGMTEGPLSETDVMEILRDHVGAPKSLCRHPNPNDPTSSQTNASIIMNLTAGRMLAARGPPCENEYHEYTL